MEKSESKTGTAKNIVYSLQLIVGIVVKANKFASTANSSLPSNDKYKSSFLAVNRACPHIKLPDETQNWR